MDWQSVGTAVGVPVIGALATWAGNSIRKALDRRRVRRWLRDNTQDEPGESHVDTLTLAKGTGLSEGRTRRACMADRDVYRASGSPEQWSIWRREPQSW